jgi:FtsH-binding integral membrane protein
MWFPGVTMYVILQFAVGCGIWLCFALQYLVYDTQQIIGGRKVELSAEEHIFGALQLYIDIVKLYLILLTLNSSSCK